MGYELDSRLATPASTNTRPRFLEGVSSVYVPQAEIQRQVERTREVMSRLYNMDNVSRAASLKRQQSDNLILAPRPLQYAEPELVSA